MWLHRLGVNALGVEGKRSERRETAEEVAGVGLSAGPVAAAGAALLAALAVVGRRWKRTQPRSVTRFVDLQRSPIDSPRTSRRRHEGR